MKHLRWIVASTLYLVIVFVLLVIFHFKFSGFSGFIALLILGFSSHALVDFALNRFKKELNKEDDVNV